MISRDELFISMFFPPSDFVSGIVVAKRIIENGKRVDVIHAKNDDQTGLDFKKHIDEYIDNEMEVTVNCRSDLPKCLFRFINNGYEAIKDIKYNRIYSRSWLMSNHFLAFEYKSHNPDVFWTAEFSDPLRLDIQNNVKQNNTLDNQEYIDKINESIEMLNNEKSTDFALLENGMSTYFIAEYLCYLFADEVIFTNPNQREIMLNRFPVDIKEFVLAKSIVKRHPTFSQKFYEISHFPVDLDDNDINIAYFGSDYYGRRHFEGIFYALSTLNHKHKGRIKLHIYIKKDELIERLVGNLDISENIIIRKPIGYLDFLNASTQYDVLIVNDLATKQNFDVNPYLPSKLSDYIGSGNDIWAIYESGSVLSGFEAKYKSEMYDFKQYSDALVEMLNDHDLADEECHIDDEDYFYNRLTYLNELIESEDKLNYSNDKKISECERKVERLTRENRQLKDSINNNKMNKILRKLKR